MGIEIGNKARARILEGANTLAKTVAVTFGPMGGNTIIDRFAGLLSTRDGVTVAREIELPDPLANQGCQILKQACIRVNDEVGDGTSQTAILAAQMLKLGHKLVAAGYSPKDIIKDLKTALDVALDILPEYAIPVESQEQIEQVAALASNQDIEISQILAEAVMAVGKDGLVVIEDGQGLESSLELKEGMEIDSGMGISSQHFADDKEKLTRTMIAPLIAVINAHLRTINDIQDLLETASQWPQNELLLICRSISGEALSTMVLNHTQGVVKSCVVEAPGIDYKRPDLLSDIAALTGAVFVDSMSGYDHKAWDAEWFGSVKQAVISQKNTILEAYDESRLLIEDRIEWLQGELRNSVSDYDRDQIYKRMARLSGGMALIKVGGATEAELKDRRARVEDALGAVQAALKEGLVPGGGSIYITLAKDIENQLEKSPGRDLFIEALTKPLEVIANNAQAPYGGKAVVHEALSKNTPWYGWDANTGGFRNLLEYPAIADPTLVSRMALESAVSVASILLTVEASIWSEKDR